MRLPSYLLLVILTGVLLCWVACSTSADSGKPEENRPNVLIILADDMGFSDIGSYGGEIPTPNLDRLAEGGLRFRQFYNAARCCPTRASLLTGQYPHLVGMGGMVVTQEGQRPLGPYQGFLNRQCVTIAEVLSSAGYKCYLSGKWHVGEFRPVWPIDRGFDHSYGLISGAMNYWNIHAGKRPGIERVFVEDSSLIDPSQDPNFYATTAFTQKALGYLDGHFENQADDPFFLYLAYTAPHWPMHAPEDRIQVHLDRYKNGWDSIRAQRQMRIKASGLWPEGGPLSEQDAKVAQWNGLSLAQQDTMIRLMATYAAMVEIMDEGIGQVVDRLEAEGQLENTLILFLSDNGACAETGTLGHNYRPDLKGPIGGADSYRSYGLSWANASNTPLRKFKQWTHEGGISTPFIVHWPAGMQKKGEWSNALGHVMDVMPTIVEVSGGTYPDQVNGQSILPSTGKSLLPIITGTKDQVRGEDEFIGWEHTGNRAIRRGRWKLVSSKFEKTWSLYDIEKDRSETQDLGEKHPEIKAELESAYAKWADEMGVK